MNIRSALIIAGLLVCGVTLAGMIAQRRQLRELREEHRRLVAQRDSPRENSPEAAPKNEPSAKASPSLELLRLRNEVSQLTIRRRELNSVASENEKLLVQFAASRTNVAKTGSPLAGYIRKSTAQNVGFDTPENTLQTFYWAIQNRDLVTLTQAFGTNMAQQFQRQMEKSARTGEDFFKGAKNIPPMRVLDRQQLPDGIMELKVGSLPESNLPETKIHFQLVNGQWKMDMK